VFAEIQIQAMIAGLAGAAVAGYLICHFVSKLAEKGALQVRARILEDAHADAERIRHEMELEARQEIVQRREEFEGEVRQTRNELRQTERRLDKREDGLDEKELLLGKKEKFLETGEKNVAEKRRELTELEEKLRRQEEQMREELHRISRLSAEEAKRILLESLQKEVESEATDMVNDLIGRAQRKAKAEAQRVVVEAIERCAAETTGEATVCTVELPSDDIKGRIIGREGRNIRSFEKAVGVDVIVDDTPGVVVLSSFDSVRREAARLAMQRLVADGRIHPRRFEHYLRLKREQAYQAQKRDLGAQLAEKTRWKKIGQWQKDIQKNREK